MSDVVTIGSKGENEQKKDEQKEQILNEEIKALRKQFRTQLKQVQEQLAKGKTLENIEQEIREKKSTLPANARDFVLMLNPEFIIKMINYQENDR